MSYTVVGCGDFYNQDREPIWCPWTQKDVGSYTLHVIGDADAKADFTHLDDMALFVACCLAQPDTSHNAHLNVVSDTVSQNEIARLLERYTGKSVEIAVIGNDELHRVIAEPDTAPEALKGASAFPVDFWFMVKGAQGKGEFARPPGMVHNGMFGEPRGKERTFERYLRERYA